MRACSSRIPDTSRTVALIAIVAIVAQVAALDAPAFQEQVLPGTLVGGSEGDSSPVLDEAKPEQAVPITPGAVLVQQGMTTGDEKAQKTCGQLSEERDQLANAYEAARTLHSAEFNDKTIPQLMVTYQLLLKRTQAEWAFYCAQSKDDLAEIAAAVKTKEEKAVAAATRAGLLAAEVAIRKQHAADEKLSKSAAEKGVKAAKRRFQKKREARQQATRIAKETNEKELERLRKFPQITQTLYGTVTDGSTGKPIEAATIKAVCLFKTTTARSRKNGRFTMSAGISGPGGRSCHLLINHGGHVSTEFDVPVVKVPTDAIFRQAVLVPEIKDAQRFRFVLSYRSSIPMMSAHVLVPMANGTHMDVSNKRLSQDNAKTSFVGRGMSDRPPYAVMDLHTAPPSFGPEAYSIHRVNDGVYHFVAANDAKRFTTTSNFAQSGARAYLFQGNAMLASAAIETSTGKQTNTWNIFSLSCLRAICSLKEVNRFV